MTKILILNTGGTIAMTGRPAYPFYAGEQLYAEVPKPEGVKLGFKAYNNLMDSTNLQHEDRAVIFSMLCEEYDSYDAFVILHGSDTLDLTSAYFGVAFGTELQKPIFVIASAMMPDETGSDAQQQLRDVLVMADLFAANGYVGVYTLCNGKVLDGSRVCKRLGHGVDIFHTPGLEPVALIERRQSWFDRLRERDEAIYKRGLVSPVIPRLAREVITLEVSADTSPFALMALSAAHGISGVILISKGEGNIPDRPFTTWSGEKGRSWIYAIDDAVHRGIPVGIRSPFEGAEFNMQRYDLGKKALTAGAISLSGLTPAMADIIFRHAIARYSRHIGHIRKYLDESTLGKLPTTKQAAA